MQEFFREGEEKRDVNFVVADEIKTASTKGRGAALDVFRGPVVSRHIQSGGGKFFHRMSQIARNGERLEEHFWHDDGTADIEHNPAFELCAHRGEGFEIGVTRRA